MSQTPQAESNLPWRLSEACFRQYESIITHAVFVLPSRFNIGPRPDKAQTTVCARLRDAIRSLHEFHWTTSVDMLKFDKYYDRIVVSQEGDQVIVSLRDRASAPVAQPETATVLTIPNKDCDSIVIRAVLELANRRILSGVKLEGVDAATIDPGAFDVAVVQRGPDTIIL